MSKYRKVVYLSVVFAAAAGLLLALHTVSTRAQSTPDITITKNINTAFRCPRSNPERQVAAVGHIPNEEASDESFFSKTAPEP